MPTRPDQLEIARTPLDIIMNCETAALRRPKRRGALPANRRGFYPLAFIPSGLPSEWPDEESKQTGQTGTTKSNLKPSLKRPARSERTKRSAADKLMRRPAKMKPEPRKAGGR